MTAPILKESIALPPPRTEEVGVILHVPRSMATLAVVTLISDLAARLHGQWEYRHPLGAARGTYHIRLPEDQP